MHLETLGLAIVIGFIAHAWISKIALPANVANGVAWAIGVLLTLVALLALFGALGVQ